MNLNDCEWMQMIVNKWKWLGMNGDDWEWMEKIENEWKRLGMNVENIDLKDNVIMSTYQYIPKLYGRKHYP